MRYREIEFSTEPGVGWRAAPLSMVVDAAPPSGSYCDFHFAFAFDGNMYDLILAVARTGFEVEMAFANGDHFKGKIAYVGEPLNSEVFHLRVRAFDFCGPQADEPFLR